MFAAVVRMKGQLVLLGATSLLVASSDAHIFARFIRRWDSHDDHGWDDDWHTEDPWHTKTKTVVKIKPVIKIKHVVKEIPVYKTVKVYKTIPVYKEVPVVKEVKVVKHIHYHHKKPAPSHPPVKGWEDGGGGQNNGHQVFIGEAEHGKHDLVGKIYEGTIKDSGSATHHQWPANAEDKEKTWSEKGWQPRESSATHSAGGDYTEEWKVQEGSDSGKHWLPPQGWVPPEGWQPPPGWQAPPGWKEWVQKRKSNRNGSVSPQPSKKSSSRRSA